MSFPYTDLATREQIIAKAAEYEIVLELDDFTGSAEYGWCLDGMPAYQWLEAMLS